MRIFVKKEKAFFIQSQKPMEALQIATYYFTQVFTFSKFKSACAVITYVLAAEVGGFDVAFMAAFSLVIFDFILGFCYGYRTKNIDRKKMKDGLWKFPLYYLAIASGYKLDEMLPGFLANAGPIHNFIIVWLGVNEFLSVAKWLSRFGVKLPMKLLERVEDYRDGMNTGRRHTDNEPLPEKEIEEDTAAMETTEAQENEKR